MKQNRLHSSKRRTGRAITIVVGSCGSILVGCGPQNFMAAGGPAAQPIAWLGWFVLIAFIVATAITWGLLLWAALRRRGTYETHASIDDDGGEGWILIGGFLAPVAVLTMFFVVTLHILHRYPMDEGQGSPEIHVVARQWWFNAHYRVDGRPDLEVTSPTEIHIPVGRPVQLDLASDDVIHSFWVPKLHGKVDMMPGFTNHVRLQADHPGTYEGQCGEYCGEQHAHMRLFIVAQTPAEYVRWLDAQRAPAAGPLDPEAKHGAEVFQAAACPMCHTVRGTAALGSIGPDLTHVASRRTIAGGSIRNDMANLAGWVTHAQTLKPGAQMPNITQFSGEELRAVVAYLQTLH